MNWIVFHEHHVCQLFYFQCSDVAAWLVVLTMHLHHICFIKYKLLAWSSYWKNAMWTFVSNTEEKYYSMLSLIAGSNKAFVIFMPVSLYWSSYQCINTSGYFNQRWTTTKKAIKIMYSLSHPGNYLTAQCFIHNLWT